MAYRFRLEAVLKLRENLEELAQQKLAREMLAMEEARLGLEALIVERRGMIASFEAGKAKPMPAGLYALLAEGIFRKEQQVEAGQARLEAAQAAVAAARDELAEKVREKKVMEKARERDYQRHLLTVLKKELNEADEQMALRFGRKTNPG